jgi:hypothetical protein
LRPRRPGGTKYNTSTFLGQAQKRRRGGRKHLFPIPHKAEAVMTSIDFKALEQASRTGMVWTEGYDGQTHYGDVFKALAPAFLILATVVGLMLAIL